MTAMSAAEPREPELRADAAPVMELSGISKAFGPVQALNGVDLAIRPGEIHAIMGENGAGKSTLISIATGVLGADAGTIVFGGSEVASPQAQAMREAGISVTFQHPALAPDLSILENLQLAATALNEAGGRAEAERLFNQVTTAELRTSIDRRVADLSLAQCHAVEIARALATSPKVLFFDEPTEPLQQAEIERLFELIKSLRQQGVAVVYVSHRLHEVTELADHISIMRDGEIIDSRAARSFTDTEIIALIAGRPLGQVFPDKSTKTGEPVVEASGLSGHGFSHVDFVARAGEIVGLTGVEGEGQREFLRALAGVNRRSEGTLKVHGGLEHGHSSAAMRRGGMGFVPDDRHAEGLFLTLSVRENLGIGALGTIARQGVVNRTTERALSQDMVEQLRVRTASIESPASELSGGNQQKVIIGREMAAGPKVLLVDEPTKGVDVGSRTEIYQRLRALADQGVAVVVCSSDGIELEGLCDRVLIFARGQIVKELTGADVSDMSITEANLTATVSRLDRSAKSRDTVRWREILASDHFPIIILAALTAIIIAGTAAINPFFLSGFNIQTMLAFLAIVTFISIAQMVTILVGAIDLSVGALAGFVVVLASFLTPDGAAGATVPANILLILFCTAAFGLLQGWLATEVRIPAIVVTLASFVGLQGLSLVLRPRAAGPITDYLSDVAQFPIVGIPFGMLLALIVVGAFEWILYRHPLGRRMRAVGSSALASGHLGINSSRHILLAFGLSGVLTGVGGLMLAGQIGMGSPATGIDYTLMSITAVVLGGASVGGGRGSFLCTLMGAAMVQSLSSASSFINSDSSVHYAVLGLVTLLAAVFFSVARLRHSVVQTWLDALTPKKGGSQMCEVHGQHMRMAAGPGSGAGSILDQTPKPAPGLPEGTGTNGRKVLIKGGAVLSMDPDVGDFADADVLIEGKKIVAVGPNLDAGDAAVVDAAGMIVMPGLIDTHHHEFETALRSFLADGLLVADGLPHGEINYYDYILQKFSIVYRPQDVYTNILYGSLAQLDNGVTGVLDVSQIHHSPEHSDAAVKALQDAGRRSAFGYFEGWGDDLKYPDDARRIKKEHFASDDQLVTMIMGGEIYIPGWEKAWEIGRDLNIPIALHIVSVFGMVPTFDKMAEDGMFGPDNIFIHMTGMSDMSWQKAADAGAHVSIAAPIEMTMRHGTPPIQKCLNLGLQPSLSSDVECTMTACMFTQMRSALTLQRMQVNARALEGETELPEILTSRDVIRFATVEAAKGLHLDKKCGSLTPGKEADIILLDATHINAAPLNHVPGAVVTLMDRSNVDTVFVAGKIRKWKGALLDVDLAKLRSDLEASRDYIFEAAKVPRDLFRV